LEDINKQSKRSTMGKIENQNNVSRRNLIKASSTTLIGMSILPTGMIIGTRKAWAVKAKSLKTDTFATLIQVSRDIYPHDKLEDKFYAQVIEGFDSAAGKSSTEKDFFENGVVGLQQASMGKYNKNYRDIGWETQRVQLLRDIEKSSFFQRIRGGLITGIYNNQKVWPLFGYEGESASMGGYLNRGFDDISWL